MKKYGIYKKDGITPVVLCYNEEGEKVKPFELRAGTKNAARRKAKRYDGTWHKDITALVNANFSEQIQTSREQFQRGETLTHEEVFGNVAT